jgi:UDP-glucose 4-epimerase
VPKIAGGKYVVIGGASLLGSHVGEQLLAGGAREVILLDNLSLGTTDNIEALLNDHRCTFLRGDMLRLNELFDPFDGADGAFCVAGFLGKPMEANPWAGLDVNVRGVQNVLEASRVRGVKKVIFSSSIGVYGAIEDDIRSEDMPLRWQTMPPALILYCASKVLGEGLGQFYAKNHGVEFLALRYSNLYGERLHTRALDATRIITAHEQIKRGERPIIDTNEAKVLDFVYIGDVARANLMAMESAATGEGINIASGEDTSIRRIVDLVLKACRSDLVPEVITDTTRMNMPFTTRVEFDISKAKNLLRWEPKVFMEEGIQRVVDWLDSKDSKAA